MSDELIGRLIDFGLGLAVGYALARAHFAWKTAKRVEDEVIHLEEEVKHIKDEGGFLSLNRHRMHDIVLALVVCLVAWSAFQAQVATDDARASLEHNAQQTDELQIANDCAARIIVTTLFTLGDRTQLVSDNAAANVRLQKAQAKFLNTPVGSTEDVRRAAFLEYLSALDEFTRAGEELINVDDPATYPTPGDYLNCLNAKEK